MHPAGGDNLSAVMSMNYTWNAAGLFAMTPLIFCLLREAATTALSYCLRSAQICEMGDNKEHLQPAYLCDLGDEM